MICTSFEEHTLSYTYLSEFRATAESCIVYISPLLSSDEQQLNKIKILCVYTCTVVSCVNETNTVMSHKHVVLTAEQKHVR